MLHTLKIFFLKNHFAWISHYILFVFLGMTSEGGGAVAFPVMTLALKVKPTVARDFSLMIQSCGDTLIIQFKKNENIFIYVLVQE